MCLVDLHCTEECDVFEIGISVKKDFCLFKLARPYSSVEAVFVETA